MTSRPLTLTIAGAALALAAAAHAQTAAPPGASALTAAAFSKPAGQSAASLSTASPSAIDLSAARRPATISYAGAPIMRHDGVAKTAIDHRFDSDGVVGSVGYLCGMDHLAPDTNLSGGGPTSGFGRQGTFLGASLGYSFR